MNKSDRQPLQCGFFGQKETAIDYTPYVYVREFSCFNQDRNKEEEKAATATQAEAAKRAERI